MSEEVGDLASERTQLLHAYRELIADADLDTLANLAATHPFASKCQYACFVAMAMMVKCKVGDLAEGFGLSERNVLHLVWALAGAFDEIEEDLGEAPAVH